MKSDRYKSLRSIEGWNQPAIQQATMMVVGVGALGNEVAKNLALLGVGHIVLVDFDRVEISNLARSVLFRMSDRGRPKAEIAARAIKELNPEVRVLSLQADVAREVGLGVFRRMDVVFGCLDSIAARYYLNRKCWRVGVPWIDGGIAGHIGMIKVFQPPESACYECTMSDEDRHALSPRRMSCSGPYAQADRPSVPTSPLIGSASGALMVQQALALLRGENAGGRGWHFNIATGESLPLKLTRQQECFSHDDHITEPIVELPASAAGLTLGDFLDLASAHAGSEVRLELGRSVVTRLTCPRCGEIEALWLDRDNLSDDRRWCPQCQTLRQPAYTQSLGHDAPWLDYPLGSLGFPPLDILSVCDDVQCYFFELGLDANTHMRWI